jgi:two-component system, NarL family, response regulator DesR
MAAVAVLTVGHEATFRQATREVVCAACGFESVAEAASAEEALESALPLRPHLALVAADMPAIDGVETAQMLKDAVPEMVVILVFAVGEPASRSPRAAAVIHQDELTPASLRALWEEHGAPST